MIINDYCRTEFESYKEFKKEFKINVPDNFNFAYDIMDRLANESPDKAALVWCNDKGEDRIFTFGEIKTLTDKCANMFLEKGIKKGDCVMTTLKRHYQYWITILALHKIGATIIPSTHQLMEKDLVYRIDTAKVTAIITAYDEELIGNIDRAQAKTGDILKLKFCAACEIDGYISFDTELEKASADFTRPTGDAATQNDDIMLIYFTSGTTGMPKMVTQNFTYPLGHILTAKFWHNLTPNDLHFSVADTGWAKASWGKIYGQWICEAAIFVYDYDNKFNPTDFLDVISKHKVTVFCAPPTIFRFLIKEDIAHCDLSSLRHCCIAGEPLNAEVYNKWKEITGLELREGFGQSETTCMIANWKYIRPRPGSMGRPAPHYHIELINDSGEPCSPGENGEICINIADGHPAGLFIEYKDEPEKNASCFVDGWYHTGDIAYKDEDGYYWFVGRADDVIKSSGYRIGPFEVESALLEHPSVLEAAITAVPDEIRGQIVKATVVLAKGYTASDELKKEMQNHVKHTTAPYKYPRIIEFVEELPKTISGKIRRVEIRNNDK